MRSSTRDPFTLVVFHYISFDSRNLTLEMSLSLSVTATETTILSFICLMALIGNLSLFIIVYKNKDLQTIANIYILNLAAADIMVSVLSIPFTVVTVITGRWLFGDTACVALGFFTILSFIASVMSLGMIAINRYFYIVKWNTYKKTFSNKKSLLYAATVWVVSISLASPPLFGWAEYRFIPGKSYCFVYWPSNVSFMYFMITVCFFGPLSAIAFSYHNILKFTRNLKRRIAVSRNNLAPPPPLAGKETQNSNYPENTKLDRDMAEIPQETQASNHPDNRLDCDMAKIPQEIQTRNHPDNKLDCDMAKIPQETQSSNHPDNKLDRDMAKIPQETQTSNNPDNKLDRDMAEIPQDTQNINHPGNKLDRDMAEIPQRIKVSHRELDLKSNSEEFKLTPEEAKMTNTILFVVALFIICWAPFAITMLFDVHCRSPLPRAVDMASLLLGYLNSMCNPILYGLRNSAFKQGFLDLYSRFLPERYRPSHVTSSSA